MQLAPFSFVLSLKINVTGSYKSATGSVLRESASVTW